MQEPIEETTPPLTMEQSFSLRLFSSQVQGMNREQAIAQLVKLYEQMLLRENQYKEILKKQWGL